MSGTGPRGPQSGFGRRGWVALLLGPALLSSIAGCGKVFDYPDSEPEHGAAVCADGVDNDFDDQVDCDDSDCDGFCSEQSLAECADGRDNDGDGLVDGADPRCWLLSPPEVQRCAEARGLDLVETFDVAAQIPWAFGPRWFLDYHQGEPSGRQDLVVSCSTPSIDDLSSAWLKRLLAFSGSWQGFELSISASVPPDALLRAAIAPIQLVPPGEEAPPLPGAEDALVSVTIDTTQQPPILALDVERTRFSTALEELGAQSVATGTTDDFSEVRVSLDDQGFYVTWTRPNGSKTELRAPRPSSLSLPPSRLVFWAGSNAPGGGLTGRVALDDVHLKVSAEHPCGSGSPQIHEQSCEFESQLAAFGHQVSVARGTDEQLCALVTASRDAYVEHPEVLTAWTSVDGAAWAPASSLAAPALELPSAAALVGASITHEGQVFEVVVAYAEAEGIRLGFASGESCGSWGKIVPGPLLLPDAEPPSYVVVDGRHEVYFTLPLGAAPREPRRRTLWRVTRSAESTWSAPERLTELPPDVASPVAIQRLGARDLVLVHPTVPGAEAGIGLLVGDAEGRSWDSPSRSPFLAVPRPLSHPIEGDLAFDGLGATSAALSWSGQSGFLLYGGSSARGSYDNGYHPLLEVGTARLAPNGESFAEASSLPPDPCGNGSCEAREDCSSCPADCHCSGPALLTQVFDGEKPWDRVSNDPHPATVQYVDVQHQALNWSAPSIIDQYFAKAKYPNTPPSTWSVLPLERAIVGDFELSFDFLETLFGVFHERTVCSLYVGLGTAPLLASVEDRATVVPPEVGVFAHLASSGCNEKYVARPSVHAGGSIFERDNETLGDPYACLLERHWSGAKPRRLTLRRNGNRLSLAVPRDDGCGVAERTVEYSGALRDLPALLIGFGGGNFADCKPWSGAGTISNLELRLLANPERCPDTQALCAGAPGAPSCVDLATSNEHCGSCGHACAANEICSSGTCNTDDPGITWLSLDGNLAPGDRAPNAELGINGLFYPFSDPCVTLDWNPETRCATGTLCELGRNYEHFGIGLGFDFLRSSDYNSRWVWDPESVGVRGLAWEISGTAPGLQVWMLNMDPSWNGECDGYDCRIPGGGDGTPKAALQGTLLFDDLVKDNWSFNTVRYTFDPKAVYGFEFNLPTEQAGGQSFAFCIDRLGVIR